MECGPVLEMSRAMTFTRDFTAFETFSKIVIGRIFVLAFATMTSMKTVFKIIIMFLRV